MCATADGLCLTVFAQAFYTRWYYSRAARRDFVLQLLAQHRRNMSKYLVANSKCGVTWGWLKLTYINTIRCAGGG